MSICTQATLTRIGELIYEHPRTVRDIAAHLGISRSTVGCAFYVMRRQGWTVRTARLPTVTRGANPMRYWIPDVADETESAA